MHCLFCCSRLSKVIAVLSTQNDHIILYFTREISKTLLENHSARHKTEFGLPSGPTFNKSLYLKTHVIGRRRHTKRFIQVHAYAAVTEGHSLTFSNGGCVLGTSSTDFVRFSVHTV